MFFADNSPIIQREAIATPVPAALCTAQAHFF
jgi:hypothetical protein